MSYWLVKTEPDVFSWADLRAAGPDGEPWTGVRNHQAKANLLAMRMRDRALVYHSNKGKEIVGIALVVRAAYPDPTADAGSWVCVDLVAERELPRPVTLAAVKANPELAQMTLARNSRLSVQPVGDAEWRAVLAMAGDTAP